MADDQEYPWLDGTEDIFTPKAGCILNASLTYRRGAGFHAYAYGYRRSAEMLFESMRDLRYADPQYFALALLWRQALELTLKRLHESLGQLELMEEYRTPAKKASDSATKAPARTHDLRNLWAAIEPRMHRFMPDVPEHGWIARAIEQFHRVDPKSEEFRYPVKAVNGTKSLNSLPNVVSLSALDHSMRALMNTLEAAGDEVDRLFGKHAEELEREEQTKSEGLSAESTTLPPPGTRR
ncbi:hypothetical protein JKA73_17625 [Myxococcus xanthus]|uniref:hypothetical protein n=1 Tax=Myxococcus xanthus TaxID=34 RepID=UPI001917317C|nr:hypothetical protein [Myxococcus xanthus]QQR47756.1 hypothetical protein JKA73_17625 [Myxococcus xanthus]